MSTMRSGLDTWLKQECVNIADKLNLARAITLDAARTYFFGIDNLSQAKEAKRYIDEIAHSPQYHLDNEDILKANRLVDDALMTDPSTRGPGASMGDKLVAAADVIWKMMLENVVECQCGEQARREAFIEAAKTEPRGGRKTISGNPVGSKVNWAGKTGTIIAIETRTGMPARLRVLFDDGSGDAWADEDDEFLEAF